MAFTSRACPNRLMAADIQGDSRVSFCLPRNVSELADVLKTAEQDSSCAHEGEHTIMVKARRIRLSFISDCSCWRFHVVFVVPLPKTLSPVTSLRNELPAEPQLQE